MHGHKCAVVVAVAKVVVFQDRLKQKRYRSCRSDVITRTKKYLHAHTHAHTHTHTHTHTEAILLNGVHIQYFTNAVHEKQLSDDEDSTDSCKSVGIPFTMISASDG